MVSTGLRGGGSRVDDRVMGALMLVAGVAGIGMYFWLVFLAPSAWAWLGPRRLAARFQGGA